MENETYEILIAKLTEIKNAIEGLNPNFWLDGNFWISFISTAILSATLVYLIKYTKATQDMKNEMVHQRIMNNAHDIKFNMTGNYLHENPDKTPFGELKVNEQDSNVINFTFLDHLGKPLGRSATFGKGANVDLFLCSNYFIETKEDRMKFLEVLKKQEGKVVALIETSIGDKFIYTYKAIHENWKKTLDTDHPNLNDEFILVKKRHKQ